MNTLTQTEYDELFAAQPQRRPCPNPTCADGSDTAVNLAKGPETVVYALCATCGGLGAVLVAPRRNPED